MSTWHRCFELRASALIWMGPASFERPADSFVLFDRVFDPDPILFLLSLVLILKWVSPKSFSTVSNPWKEVLLLYYESSSFFIPFYRSYRLSIACYWSSSISTEDVLFRFELFDPIPESALVSSKLLVGSPIGFCANVFSINSLFNSLVSCGDPSLLSASLDV